MSTLIASTASIDPRAEIAEGVEIGPFCVIGPQVRIGRGTRLENSVTLMGRTTLGQGNRVYPGAVIGAEPQDLSYDGGDTEVVIGDGNVIRECVTINRATRKENGATRIGSDNYLMACCHVAHDCRLGDHIVIANGVLLGGHVFVDDHATLAGFVGVHHYTTVGCYCFVTGASRVMHDVPPFMLMDGAPCRPRCVNVVALKRNDFSPDSISALAEAHRLIYRAKVGLQNAAEQLRSKDLLFPEVVQLLDYVQTQQQGRHGRARELRRAA